MRLSRITPLNRCPIMLKKCIVMVRNKWGKTTFTSIQAMRMLLKGKYVNDLIYLQGTKLHVEEYKARGLHITMEYSDKNGAIAVAFDPDFTGEKVYTTCEMLTKHALPYYAANPDGVRPVE